jgi:antitoxin (DNA-binding transcriptional repressor) of toxin-antitoxin stability system
MRFVTIKDLRSKTAAIRKDLSADEEIVVTANGRPIALLTAVAGDNLEEELLAHRRARARAALDRTRALSRRGRDVRNANAGGGGGRGGGAQGARLGRR